MSGVRFTPEQDPGFTLSTVPWTPRDTISGEVTHTRETVHTMARSTAADSLTPSFDPV